MMDKDKIIQKGDVAKYQIAITHEDFDQHRDDFYVVLHYGMTNKKLRIDKQDMVEDESNQFFLMFPSSDMTGMIKAETHYLVPDYDMDDMVRDEVEWSCLGFVTDSHCPLFSCHCRCDCCDENDNNHVKFKRVWRSDVSSLFLYLRTRRGEPFMCSDEMMLRVPKNISSLT